MKCQQRNAVAEERGRDVDRGTSAEKRGRGTSAEGRAQKCRQRAEECRAEMSAEGRGMLRRNVDRGQRNVAQKCVMILAYGCIVRTVL